MSIFLTCIDVNTQHLAAAAAAERVFSLFRTTDVCTGRDYYATIKLHELCTDVFVLYENFGAEFQAFNIARSRYIHIMHDTVHENLRIAL